MSLSCRHCEERSDEAIQNLSGERTGLLRCARNDGVDGCSIVSAFERAEQLTSSRAVRCRP
ncbi:hypothetical protein EHH60_33525 [Bradyrhizobium sp. RP6]|nr:hypothetical protein EHH60_33525 [Bradyrhizobium sp. RP6]